MPVEWNDDQILAAIEAGVFRGIVIGTEMVRTEGNRLMRSSPRSGRVYRRRGVEHKASAPGEPPAPDTGRLIQSARTEFKRQLLQGTAIWSTDYAERLEKGTPKMAARPFAMPALINKRVDIINAIATQVRMEVGS